MAHVRTVRADGARESDRREWERHDAPRRWPGYRSPTAWCRDSANGIRHMFREARDDGGTGKRPRPAPPEHDVMPSSLSDFGACFDSRCLLLWRAARCPMPLSKSKELTLCGRGPSSVSHRVFEDYPPQFPPRNPAQRAVAGPIIRVGEVSCNVGRWDFGRRGELTLKPLHGHVAVLR